HLEREPPLTRTVQHFLMFDAPPAQRAAALPPREAQSAAAALWVERSSNARSASLHAINERTKASEPRFRRREGEDVSHVLRKSAEPKGDVLRLGDMHLAI